MRIALGQYSVVSGDLEINRKKIRQYAEAARNENGVAMVCLPELCTTGFNWQLNAELKKQWPETRRFLSELARGLKISICGSFLEEGSDERATNSFLYFNGEGELLVKYDKIHLFSAFNEEKHVEPGNEVRSFDTDFGRIGCSTCYDLRFPEIFRKNSEAGATIHLLAAAFPKPRLAHWRTLIQARAIENHSFVIATNQCGFEGPEGTERGTEYFGHSMVVGPEGNTIVEAGEAPGLHFAEIDLSRVAVSRKVFDSIADRRPEVYFPKSV